MENEGAEIEHSNFLDLISKKPSTHPIGLPIPICVSNGKAYIWEVDQVERLRTEHNISGLLTGTLPQLVQQNVFLGLPLQLLPEEVVLLVDLGIAFLVDDVNSHRMPTPEEAAQYRTKRDKEIDEEKKLILIRDAERRVAARELYQSQIAAANEKRRARQHQQQSTAELVDGMNPEESVHETVLPPDQITDENQSISQLSRLPYFVPIHLQSQPPIYASQKLSVFSDLHSAHQAGLWTYPHDQYQRARCAVFAALWRQGMFLGIGFKFGCDFLVYPGDSLRFHSHFACTVISHPQTPVAPLSLVSYGRLATAVKKSHLLACWDENNKTVKFLSLEWAGMG